MAVLYIDDVDISTYGVVLRDNPYNDIVQFPSLKSVVYNDWAEDDGIDPDLADLHLESKEVNISFGVLQDGDVSGFYELLSEGGYREFEFVELGITHRLRLKKESNLKITGFTTFTLTFVDDFPLDDYNYLAPTLTGAKSVDCSLGYSYVEDNETIDVSKDLSVYGVYIYNNIEEEISKKGDVKQALSCSNDYMNGEAYDVNAPIKYKEKDVTLSCFMHLPIVDFWKGYNALLFDLTRSGGNVITYGGVDYDCYYKSSNVKELALHDSKIWVKFDLKLCFYKG